MGGLIWKPLLLLLIFETITSSEARWRVGDYQSEPLQYPMTTRINRNALKVIKPDDNLRSQVRLLENVVREFLTYPNNIVERLSDAVEKLETILEPFYRKITRSFHPQPSRRSAAASAASSNSSSSAAAASSSDENELGGKKDKKRQKIKHRKRAKKRNKTNKGLQQDKKAPSDKKPKPIKGKTRGMKKNSKPGSPKNDVKETGPEGQDIKNDSKKNKKPKLVKKGNKVSRYNGKMKKLDVSESEKPKKNKIKDKIKAKGKKVLKIFRQNVKTKKFKNNPQFELVEEKNHKLDKDKKKPLIKKKNEISFIGSLYRSTPNKTPSKSTKPNPPNHSNKDSIKLKPAKENTKKKHSNKYKRTDDNSPSEQHDEREEDSSEETTEKPSYREKGFEENSVGENEDGTVAEEKRIKYKRTSPKVALADEIHGGTSVAVSAGEGASVTVSASRRALRGIDKKYWPKLYLQEYEKYIEQKKRLGKLDEILRGSNDDSDSGVDYYRRLNTGKNKKRKKSRKLRNKKKKRSSASAVVSASEDGTSVAVSASRRNNQ